jgi:hypothetical protein
MDSGRTSCKQRYGQNSAQAVLVAYYDLFIVQKVPGLPGTLDKTVWLYLTTSIASSALSTQRCIIGCRERQQVIAYHCRHVYHQLCLGAEQHTPPCPICNKVEDKFKRGVDQSINQQTATSLVRDTERRAKLERLAQFAMKEKFAERVCTASRRAVNM